MVPGKTQLLCRSVGCATDYTANFVEILVRLNFIERSWMHKFVAIWLLSPRYILEAPCNNRILKNSFCFSPAVPPADAVIDAIAAVLSPGAVTARRVLGSVMVDGL